MTVNTDNRFISETDLTNEYLTAARMTEGGIPKMVVLRLIKNGFKAAFLPKDERDELLREIDREIFEIMLEEIFSEEGRSPNG